jgi:membrane-associated protease RseP (regulator of RpoE activity)
MTDLIYDYDLLDAILNRAMSVEDRTVGTAKLTYILRYRGRLRAENTEEAYDSLAGELRPLNLTPLFRMDEGRHTVLLIPSLSKPAPSNPRINLLLGVFTLFSVLLIGGIYGAGNDPVPTDGLGTLIFLAVHGWPYAISLMAILGAHEFGHYLMGRHHGVQVSLPYFIPFPFPELSPFGTLGAFINMKEMPKNRKILLDIGIAGPLAGMLVAIPVLLLGLRLSNLNTLVALPDSGYSLEGNNLIYLFAKYLTFGKLLPAPESYAGISPLFYWIRYFFTSMPLPAGGLDVNLHPVAWAGWAGLLVTSLNLIPVGQLDGGHVLYVLFGRNVAQKITPFILGILVVLGLVWTGWWLWAGLIYFMGKKYAEPLDQISPIDTRRKLLGGLALLVFILTFTPVPLTTLFFGQ